MVRESKSEHRGRGARYILVSMITVFVMGFASPRSVHAEYGDIILNQRSGKEGMAPVVFPHWFHRIRFRCKVCHADLGFPFKLRGADINMLKIIDGEYCGACHNGKIAWSVQNCGMCHSGKAGEKTHIVGSVFQNLLVPPAGGEPVRAKAK